MKITRDELVSELEKAIKKADQCPLAGTDVVIAKLESIKKRAMEQSENVEGELSQVFIGIVTNSMC